MVLPTLPNDIILKIIKQADGGLTTHKKKMSETLKNISLGPNCIVEYEGNFWGDSKVGEEGFCDRDDLMVGQLQSWGDGNPDGIYTKLKHWEDGYDEEWENRVNTIWPKPEPEVKPIDIWSLGC